MPVWDALSSLFLDTDISLERSWRARILAQSPYSIAELEEILTEEVRPVCWWNMLAVAGPWAGFDLEWLRDSILRQAERPSWLSRLGRKRILKSQEWQATRALTEHLRTSAGAQSVVPSSKQGQAV